MNPCYVSKYKCLGIFAVNISKKMLHNPSNRSGQHIKYQNSYVFSLRGNEQVTCINEFVFQI
jgi:hypothetical protein